MPNRNPNKCGTYYYSSPWNFVFLILIYFGLDKTSFGYTENKTIYFDRPPFFQNLTFGDCVTLTPYNITRFYLSSTKRRRNGYFLLLTDNGGLSS